MSFADGPPDEKLRVLYGTLLIGELLEEGLIAGSFSVNMDWAWASITMLEMEGAEKPSKSEAVETAMGLMRVKGIEDEEMMRDLLTHTKVELPA